MHQPYSWGRSITIIGVAVFAIWVGFHFVVLSSPNLINQYPYLSADSFDWYTEGVYLIESMRGAALPILPVLRPPIFVILCAFDYLSGGSGLVLGAFLTLTIFMTFYWALKILDLVNKKSFVFGPILILALGLTIYPLNYVKLFLLADGLAVCLSIGAVFLIMRSQSLLGGRHFYWASIALAMLASLTQTYALIPYLVACAWLMLIARLRSNTTLEILNAMLISIVGYIVITWVWRQSVPHIKTPENFSLIHLSGAMGPYYLQTWGFYLAPPLTTLFCLFVLQTIPFRGRVAISSLVINYLDPPILAISISLVAIFASLCFFYQWPDARFTYYFWPWFLIGILILMNGQKLIAFGALAGVMLLMVFMVPSDYWAPQWGSAQFLPRFQWVSEYSAIPKAGRNIQSCQPNCSESIFQINPDPYINSVLNIYVRALPPLESQ